MLAAFLQRFRHPTCKPSGLNSWPRPLLSKLPLLDVLTAAKEMLDVPKQSFPGSFFGPPTLVALLEHRAKYQPEAATYRFLVDGESEEVALTNQELDCLARRIAHHLQSQGLQGERALLLFPAGLEFIAAFFGCLYAGVVAVPAYPPRMNRSLDRIQTIAQDAQAKVALTTSDVWQRMQNMLPQTPFLQHLTWVQTDTLPPGGEEHWQDPGVDGSTLAMLQYTSGSTGTPNGVMLTHANLLHNSALICYAFEHTRSGTGVFWLPSYHDMGLIGGIIQPLYVGRPNILMSPMAFLQRPLRWLKAITRYRGTTSGGPNFAYELCLKRIRPEQLDQLDLSSWQVAFNGAEPIRPETLERFAERFAPCGFRYEAFYPCYGLAESTLIATGGYKPDPPVILSVDAAQLEQNTVVETAPGAPGTRRLVGCGQRLPDLDVIVVDPETGCECPEGKVGEIWISGPSVAQGYWNRPEKTEQTFRAFVKDTGEGPYLRTGDLGFFHRGELYCTGRLKDLIIIRGRNHYPQDIELTAQQSHPALRSEATAAFTVEGEDGHERLVIVQELERRQDKHAAEAIQAIRRAVAREHDLVVDAVALIRAGSIPKTSSGKIQRHACRRAWLDGTLTVIAAWPGDVELDETASAAEVATGDDGPGGADFGAGEASALWEVSASEGNGQPQAAAEPGPQKPVASADRTPAAPTTPPARQLSFQEAARIVMEEVRRIAGSRAQGATLDSTFSDVGMDSLERVELQAALEDRLGGRIPEDQAPQVESFRQVAHLVHQYLGHPEQRQSLSLEEIPESYYRIEQWPEYQQLRQNLSLLETSGLGNPYFNVHERVTRDTTQIGGRELINFSSYNYVGMSGDPQVAAAAKEAIDRYGTSVSASRLVSGEKTIHRELEHALADWLGTEDAVVMVGGHATNETVIGHLMGPGDLIVHDALAHNSILQGCILSGARRRSFTHNDPEALEAVLRETRGQFRRVLIVIEGVYSMDGDIAPLPQFIELKKKYKALLMIDEAHSIGVLGRHGRGIGEHFDVDPADVDIWMGTMSKSLGSCGGYIAGSRALVEYLKYTAPGFVYSVGIPPAAAAAALASLQVLRREPQRVERLHQRSRLFLELAQQRGLNTGLSQGTPIVPVILGNSLLSLQLSRALYQRGVNVQPILYPAVEENAARLRFFITCTHTEEQIRYTVDAMAEELARLTDQQQPLAQEKSG